MYLIGKTGVGKSTLLENMAIADMRAGRGVCFVDPHGSGAETLLDFVPEERIDDVIYFNPADTSQPVAFNPLASVDYEFRHLIASGILGVFKKIWPDVWSARMEYILNNALLTLLEYPGSTLLGIMRLLAEKDYRNKLVNNLRDPVIKAFWQNEFERYTERLAVEGVAAIQNKVGQFVSNPLIRNIIGQQQSSFDMRKVMDEGKILICNISKGRIGESNSALLGAMIITQIQLAAMSRADTELASLRDFYLYVDEFQNFSTDSFANILSEARKYRLNLILAHQYIEQLSETVRPAIFGNVGTIVSFRVGAEDAEFLEKEFMPEFTANDLVNLPKHHIYVKLMIDGIAQKAFSAVTLEPLPRTFDSHKDIIIENSRTRFGTPQRIIEEKIAAEWLGTSSANEKVDRRGESSLARALGERPRHDSPRRQEADRPEKQDRRERPRVDIDDLRKAIEDSLKSVGQEAPAEPPVAPSQPLLDDSTERDN